MVENRRREPDSVIFGRNCCQPRSVVPVPLAIIGFGPAWPWALRARGERA
jgi:hypothetical protein